MSPGLILFLFIFGNCRCFVDSDCDEILDCEACTSHDSWSGANSCRWCPLDRKCHAYMSPVNPCKSGQNIKLPSDCQLKSYGWYNPVVAYEQALFSTAAYSADPQTCLAKILPDSDFEVVDIIKGSCDDFLFDYEECFVYTAVSCEKKTILVAFRGTEYKEQLFDQLLTVLAVPESRFKIGGKVQTYFANANNKLYPCVHGAVEELVKRYPDFNVQITGHSLGGAIASLSSAALVYDKVLREDKMSLYTFGMPRVGDKEYAVNHDKLVNNSWRVVHYKDVVVHLPMCNIVTGCDVKNGPYHHRTEVFYPSANMTKSSSYIVCEGNEDNACSNGVIKSDPCLMDVGKCVNYHTHYFGIPTGTYCEQFDHGNQTDTKLHFQQFRYETCRRILRKPRERLPVCQDGGHLQSARGAQNTPEVNFTVLAISFVCLVYFARK